MLFYTLFYYNILYYTIICYILCARSLQSSETFNPTKASESFITCLLLFLLRLLKMLLYSELLQLLFLLSLLTVIACTTPLLCSACSLLCSLDLSAWHLLALHYTLNNNLLHRRFDWHILRHQDQQSCTLQASNLAVPSARTPVKN